MKINVTKTIGNSSLNVEIDERDDKEAISKATVFMQPDKCGMQKPDGTYCNSEFVTWESNKAQTDEGTFTYIKRRCSKCGATSTLGEYKGGGYFWKKWEIFVKDTTADTPSNHPTGYNPKTDPYKNDYQPPTSR